MTTPNPNEPATTREREVIVTNDGRRGYGGIVVAVLAIVVIALIGLFVVNALSGDGDGGGVSVPDEIDVNVDSGSGG